MTATPFCGCFSRKKADDSCIQILPEIDLAPPQEGARQEPGRAFGLLA